MKVYDNDINRREFAYYLLSFNEDQFKEIMFGKLIGLTLDQINMYAHPDINSYSMKVIIDCIRSGMDVEKIKILANPELKNVGKVTQIRIGFECGLSIEEVLSYADPKYTVKEMIDMRLKLVSDKEGSV